MNLKRGDLILTVHVIYDHPADYPEYFVVREWAIAHGISTPVPGSDIVLADTLKEARESIPKDRRNIGRDPKDDSKIVEMWVKR